MISVKIVDLVRVYPMLVPLVAILLRSRDLTGFFLPHPVRNKLERTPVGARIKGTIFGDNVDTMFIAPLPKSGTNISLA